MPNDWQLHYDNDNEIYTTPDEATRENIERWLGRFDGVRQFEFAIFREMEDTGLRCMGEPDRRIIEGMRNGASYLFG
jgi:hypothetical protein